jgi:hypothetical protein
MSGRSGNNNARILRRSARHPSFDSSNNNNNNSSKVGGGAGVGESSEPLQRESRAVASKTTNKNAGAINTTFRVGDQVEVRICYDWLTAHVLAGMVVDSVGRLSSSAC